MNDDIVANLRRLDGSLKAARAEMAQGQPSVACLMGVIYAVYSQADDMRDRWHAQDMEAFTAFERKIAERGGPLSVEDYDALAAEIDGTYAAAHKITASDAVEGVLRFAFVSIALCNSAVFDAVAFAAVMSLVDFYLEPVADFPDYLKQTLRGILFASISGPLEPAEVAEAMRHAYTGEAAAGVTASLERAVLIGLRFGLNGGQTDIKGRRWRYFGPEDERNRVFCEHMVIGENEGRPRLYTADMINGCANGFGTNVWDDMGGINCRHVLLPISAGTFGDFQVIGDYRYESFILSGGNPSRGTAPRVGRYVVPINEAVPPRPGDGVPDFELIIKNP